MGDEGQRDRAIEHVLRRGAARVPAATDACLDGETLAAWSSGALAQTDAARVEEHLADCARCQSMLAAFARTAPSNAPTVTGWRGYRFRWLIPFAAAATVAGIWVTLPQRNEPVRSAVESPAPLEADQRAAPTPQAPIPPAPSLRDRTASTPTVESAPPRREAAANERKEERRLAAAAEPPAAAPVAAPPAMTAPPPPAAGAAAADSIAAAPEARQMMARSLAPEFASPDGATRWRIVNGQVQRSTTQGKSWEPVTLPAGVTITAGHSPTASVAWLVGRAGAILVTTDGATVERVPFISSADLASVVALDDRQATVTAVDGRAFRTTNRGTSWEPR